MATSENVNSQLIGSVLSYMEDLKIASLRARLKIISKELETAKRNSFNQQKSKETRMSDNVNTSKSDNQVKGYIPKTLSDFSIRSWVVNDLPD